MNFVSHRVSQISAINLLNKVIYFIKIWHFVIGYNVKAAKLTVYAALTCDPIRIRT